MTGPADFLGRLNPRQRAAAEHCAGPLLVIAGAGSGKTKTLAVRVAALIRGGADADRILAGIEELYRNDPGAREILDEVRDSIGQLYRAWGKPAPAI